MSFRGIDIRESGTGLLFRTLLQDSTGALVPSGNAQLRLYEYQPTGRLHQYDFSSVLQFTSGVLITSSGLMTQRKVVHPNDNAVGGQDTGIWTFLLPHVSGFTPGNLYLARTTHISASPTDQYREFQFGDGVFANIQSIQDLPPTVVFSSAVWMSQTSQFSVQGTFGGENQPVYYADIKQYHDQVNSRDEYGVEWYKGAIPLNSGNINNPAISVYNTSDGSTVFQNKVMTYASPILGVVRYNSSLGEILPSGEPFYCITSGLIDGSTRTWSAVVGRNNI